MNFTKKVINMVDLNDGISKSDLIVIICYEKYYNKLDEVFNNAAHKLVHMVLDNEYRFSYGEKFIRIIFDEPAFNEEFLLTLSIDENIGSMNVIFQCGDVKNTDSYKEIEYNTCAKDTIDYDTVNKLFNIDENTIQEDYL